jgi:nucleotide-binding universal stress UspA family protein
MLAGEGTRHAGFGPCQAHGSSAQHRAWELALEVARELNVSPWDALLKATRLAAGRVAWVDLQLDEATRANDGDAGTPAVRNWLKESRLERTLLARTAKAAIDAGVAERLVRQVELEGRLVAEVLGRTLDALELTAEQRQTAFATAHRELLALESSTTEENG